MCTAPPTADVAPKVEDKDEPTLLFTGGKNKMVSYLKKASIGNLFFAGLSAPVLHWITSINGNGGKGIAMSAILLTFGGLTTGGLNWVCGTYICTMTSIPGGQKLSLTTPTLLGGTKTTEIAWDSISRPSSWHPFSTFEAGGKMFYLDVDDGEFHDETLVDKIEDQLNK